VLALGVIAGLAGVAVAPFASPEQFMLASDVYRYAAEAMLAGGAFYEVSPPRLPGYTFVYPPVVALFFVPHAVVGTAAWAYAVQTLFNLAAGLGIARVTELALEDRGVTVGRLDRTLMAAFALFSAHSAITLLNGQVTILLGFAVAVGLYELDRGRETVAGAAFAAAALVKVFPAAIGLWLLRRRAWRGTAAAIATGVGGLALGAAVLGPDVSATYLQDVLLARWEGETFDGVPDPDQSAGGAQRQIAALTGLGSPALAVLALLVLVPPLAVMYRRIDTDRRRQAAVLGTIVATLLFVPLQRLYMPLFAFPLVVLLYTLPAGRARSVLLAGVVVSYVRVTFGLVTAVVTALPLPPGIESATAAAFTFALPPTLGLWLLLAACVLVHVDFPEREAAGA